MSIREIVQYPRRHQSFQRKCPQLKKDGFSPQKKSDIKPGSASFSNIPTYQKMMEKPVSVLKSGKKVIKRENSENECLEYNGARMLRRDNEGVFIPLCR